MQYDVISNCRAAGISLATAESITAGMVSSKLAEVPGCSSVLRGGIIAYATDVKHSVLGIDHALLEHVVSEQVAVEMAKAACRIMGADLGVATTGVGGPDWLDEQPPGTVWIAIHDARTGDVLTRRLTLEGDRGQVREHTAGATMGLILMFISKAPHARDSGIA